ncbi:MAG: NADH-quinone oxidoreductase subunit H [Sandaracinaceae bacterium]|nr:NADH-quinone oxidoreductase subunit H [Sandaracinaceae bacterium]
MLLLVISTLLKIAFVLALIGGVAPILVWAERRQSAMFQDRVGPVRAGVPLPMELWNLVMPAGASLILAGWLMDGTLTPLYVVFGQPQLQLDHGTMAYSWLPVVGPWIQLFALDNPWYYDVVPLLAGLTQIGGIVVFLTAVTFKDRLSVAEFVKGPAATGAGVLGRVGAAYAVWVLIAIILHYANGGDAARREAMNVVLGQSPEVAIAALGQTFTLMAYAGAAIFVVLGALAVGAAMARSKSGSVLAEAAAYFFGVGALSGVITLIIGLASDPANTFARLAADPSHVPGGNAYLTWSFIIALGVGLTHIPLGWIVRNSVDKRGHLTVFGLIHPAVDVLKTAWKEDFIPPHADKLLHSAAPIIALIPAFATFAVIPFGPDLHWGPSEDPLAWLFIPWSQGSGAEGTTIHLQVANINVGILYIFAIAGTGIVGAAIAGYSSDNKYSLLGGLRAASQMVSYEVTLGLTLVGCFMAYGTLLLDHMVEWQINHVWGFVIQPLALVLFFFASIAEMKRVPFDAPEGESEIVAGYMLEYSSMKFLMFMTGEFVEHVVSSGLIVTLFFGGYHMPFLSEQGFMLGEYLGFDIPLPHIIVVLMGVLAFVGKMAIVMFMQLQVRWTLPRFRYDQTMQLCWKIILPLSLVNILVTGVVILMLQ